MVFKGQNHRVFRSDKRAIPYRMNNVLKNTTKYSQNVFILLAIHLYKVSFWPLFARQLIRQSIICESADALKINHFDKKNWTLPIRGWSRCWILSLQRTSFSFTFFMIWRQNEVGTRTCPPMASRFRRHDLRIAARSSKSNVSVRKDSSMLSMLILHCGDLCICSWSRGRCRGCGWGRG